MQYTDNYFLRKPERTEPTKVADINYNSDLIDTALKAQADAIGNRVEKVTGKGLSTNDYTTTEKNKLAGIETGATKPLVFANKTVSTSAWVSSSTYADYGFKADITCSGVTTDYVPTVNFGMDEAVSGIFAPIAESGNGKVTIYASEEPEDTITIPTIVCVKGGI